MSEMLGALVELAIADPKNELDRLAGLIQQTLDNFKMLGVSEADAMKALVPLLQEVSNNWLTELMARGGRTSGANATKSDAESRRDTYQVLADIVLERSTRNLSKREVSRRVQQLIIDAGGDEKSIETIRKNIKIPS